MGVYLGRWSSRDEMVNEFYPDYGDTKAPPDFPSDDEVLFAAYGGGSYDGTAAVYYRRDGTLYEVHGSHCSCYGLENQWEPEATTADAVKRQSLEKYDFDTPVIEAFGVFKASL